MLCSGDELHLTSDADGILILPAETPVGLSVADVLGDVVLDVDVKPNRGDALSIIGLAREVAAATGARSAGPRSALPRAATPPATTSTWRCSTSSAARASWRATWTA